MKENDILRKGTPKGARKAQAKKALSKASPRKAAGKVPAAEKKRAKK